MLASSCINIIVNLCHSPMDDLSHMHIILSPTIKIEQLFIAFLCASPFCIRIIRLPKRKIWFTRNHNRVVQHRGPIIIALAPIPYYLVSIIPAILLCAELKYCKLQCSMSIWYYESLYFELLDTPLSLNGNLFQFKSNLSTNTAWEFYSLLNQGGFFYTLVRLGFQFVLIWCDPGRSGATQKRRLCLAVADIWQLPHLSHLSNLAQRLWNPSLKKQTFVIVW